jgi:hypothetical protein
VNFAWWPVGQPHRLSNLLFPVHPPAQFLSSVLVNISNLIFVTVLVRHAVPHSVSDFLEGSNLSKQQSGSLAEVNCCILPL